MTITAIEPAAVVDRAREIHTAWQADPEMPSVLEGCALYTREWDDFYGGPLVSEYSVTRGAQPLLEGALRVMAPKSALYELTGDELLAELPVPVPLDVTCHALRAQFTALSRVHRKHARPARTGRRAGRDKEPTEPPGCRQCRVESTPSTTKALPRHHPR
ncbi:hypothetical protein GCM10010497_58540 [Streptomyces cinereoruber]|uniref:DUF4440 domain-containing protein n=1 Tax=Streptomyces cinereoruber TaxID=67260 RepID=A0AAV4KS40_9ACTN|nr:hypothetical protein [Streptomyces cinereoruber]NIH65480.1 hypothetical protein [Streptomyces cinereoruber]GGR47472.1 hypothetical protein GCM10010497_58540 [Streptomyces cinereoruber]